MSAIIFDFDGTIANSFDYIADHLARAAGRPALTSAERQALKNLSMIAMARCLGHPWWRLPLLFTRGRRGMNGVIGQLEPFAGMPLVIKKLHAEGHELFIVTSNSVQNARDFLHSHDLHTYFLQIYGGVSLFGKAPALRRLLREQHFEVGECVYIGDEVRDVEAAQAINLRVIVVRWGFARQAALEALRPTAIADTPDDIVRILEEI